MNINAVSGQIVDTALRVHKELLINFVGEFLKGTIERLVNGLEENCPNSAVSASSARLA